MNRRRLLMVALAALLVLPAAVYFTASRDASPGAQQVKLLPTLAGELDTVTSLTLHKGGAGPDVTVHRVNGDWRVAERADYPADLGKLRTLLINLGDARIVEEKTANPANFAVIGVADPAGSGGDRGGGAGGTGGTGGTGGAAGTGGAGSTGSAEGAGGIALTVTARDGAHTLIIGKPSGEGSFARRAQENQSYLVEPALSPDAEPRSWIDPRLLDIASAAILRIESTPAGGEAYTLHRQNAQGTDFSLEGVPDGRKALDAPALAPAPNLLAALTAEDVAPLDSIDFSKASRLVVTLADGDVLTLLGAVAGDRHWLQVKSVKDVELNAKTRGRALEVASYRYDALFRPLEQLLVPRTPAGSAGGSRAGSKPAPPPAPGRAHMPRPPAQT